MPSVSSLLRAHGTPPREVYFDHENSGRVPSEIVEAMLPYFNEKGYGHPSITNKPGWEALEVVESTSEVVAATLGVEPSQIHFVHSGTEANNLAILGSMRALKRKGRIVISDIEHYSVLLPALSLEEAGFRVVRAPVDEEGFVDVDVMRELVDRETVLVSIQAVNHEIGTVQKIKEIVEIVKDKNPDVIVHTDACDAFGRIPLRADELGVDMVTLSSHKILGPKGVGVLWASEEVRVEPVLKGALSSQTLWPGVENIPALAGFRKAVELISQDEFASRVSRLRDRLIEGILNRVPETLLNGPTGEMRAPDNANISFLHVEGEALTVDLSLRGVYVSSGSACTSRVLEPSHVMIAIGRDYEAAHGSLLFKLTRYHSELDVDYAVEQVVESVDRLRGISPLGKG